MRQWQRAMEAIESLLAGRSRPSAATAAAASAATSLPPAQMPVGVSAGASPPRPFFGGVGPLPIMPVALGADPAVALFGLAGPSPSKAVAATGVWGGVEGEYAS
jgi:hypothetical protein